MEHTDRNSTKKKHSPHDTLLFNGSAHVDAPADAISPNPARPIIRNVQYGDERHQLNQGAKIPATAGTAVNSHIELSTYNTPVHFAVGSRSLNVSHKAEVHSDGHQEYHWHTAQLSLPANTTGKYNATISALDCFGNSKELTFIMHVRAPETVTSNKTNLPPTPPPVLPRPIIGEVKLGCDYKNLKKLEDEWVINVRPGSPVFLSVPISTHNYPTRVRIGSYTLNFSETAHSRLDPTCDYSDYNTNFIVPRDAKNGNYKVTVWTEDSSGNRQDATFYVHVMANSSTSNH